MLAEKSLIAVLLGLTLVGCSVGPDYVRPAAEVPAAFADPGAWKPAAAAPALPEKWWTAFGDPLLNALAEQLLIDNQNLKAAEAQYRAARGVYDAAQATAYPTLSASGGASRGNTVSGSTSSGRVATTYSLGASASWEMDVWGRIRRNVEAADAKLLASEADLGAARLSAQVLLAQTYFQWRAAQRQASLLASTMAANERFLSLTQNRYKSGVASALDVAQAETQLGASRTQALEIELQRTQLQNALATLVGKTRVALAVEATTALPSLPAVPPLIPSELLESRYDILAAERRAAAASAQIGVAKTAWFPVLSLGASTTYRNNALAGLLSVPNRIWSFGPTLAQAIFDGGARNTAIVQAEAGYDQAVASYRQTVLSAFQEVEDNLAAARLLAQEAQSQGSSVAAARRARQIAENQYQAGTISALNVVSAQTTALAAEKTELDIWTRNATALAQLYKNVGGRAWNAAAAARSDSK